MTARTVWGFASDHESAEWQGAFETREAAIAAAPAALHLHPGDAYFVAAGSDPDVEDHVPTLEFVVDFMRESLREAANVPGQDLVVDAGAGEALDTALRLWARKYIGPTKWAMSAEPERIVFNPAPSEANGKSTEVKEL